MDIISEQHLSEGSLRSQRKHYAISNVLCFENMDANVAKCYELFLFFGRVCIDISYILCFL